MSDSVLDELRGRLADPAGQSPHAHLPTAAVAALLRPGTGTDLELLLIRRAQRHGDIWSGHIALPGGRAQEDDASLVETARRETIEEVGLDPRDGGELLGALSPVLPRNPIAPRIAVYPFVWHVPHPPPPTPNAEVAAADWVSVRWLASPDAVTQHVLNFSDGQHVTLPGISVGSSVLWGITYRIVSELLQRGAWSHA